MSPMSPKADRMSGVIDLVPSIGMAKKMCPRLRDSASGRGGDFTQPRTNFFGHLCTFCQSMHEENNCSLDRALPCQCPSGHAVMRVREKGMVRLREIKNISSLLLCSIHGFPFVREEVRSQSEGKIKMIETNGRAEVQCLMTQTEKLSR